MSVGGYAIRSASGFYRRTTAGKPLWVCSLEDATHFVCYEAALEKAAELWFASSQRAIVVRFSEMTEQPELGIEI